MMVSFFLKKIKGFLDPAASVECHLFFRVCPSRSETLLFWCLSCQDDGFGFLNTQFALIALLLVLCPGACPLPAV